MNKRKSKTAKEKLEQSRLELLKDLEAAKKAKKERAELNKKITAQDTDDSVRQGVIDNIPFGCFMCGVGMFFIFVAMMYFING